MQVCLHVGVHKTGSSLIQLNLSKNLNVLRQQRVFYVNEELPGAIARQRQVLRKLQLPGRARPTREALTGVNRKILEAAQANDADIILISEENRIGFPLHTQMARVGAPAKFYPLASECLRLVLFGLEHLQTTLLVYQRSFDQLLPSLYAEGLRNLILTDTLDGFCRKIDFASLDYAALLHRIQVGAPHAKVINREFETVRDGVEEFLSGFCNDLGIDATACAFETRMVREGVDVHGAAQLLALAERRASEGMSKQLNMARRKILAQSIDPSARMVLPDWATELLSEMDRSERHIADQREKN